MAENFSESQHIASLDFEISQIPRRLEEVERYLRESGQNVQQIIREQFNFDNSFQDLTAGSNNAIKEIEQIRREWNGVLRDFGSETSILNTSHAAMEAQKQELLNMVRAYGEVTNSVFRYNARTQELTQATITYTDGAGRTVVENFKMQKQAVGEAVDGVQQYQKVWKQVGSTATDNVKQRAAALEKEAATNKRLVDSLQQQAVVLARIQNQAKQNVSLSAYGKQAAELREQIELLRQKLSSENQITAEQREQIINLQRQTDALNAQTRIRAYDNPVVNNRSLLQETASKLKWYLAGSAAFGAGYIGKETIQTLTEVEYKVMEITRVMNDATLNVNAFRDQLFSLAVEYGRSFEDVSEVALRFAQAGYNVQETLSMTRDSLLALNTAELDVQNSTESMIGIMQQWNFTADELSTIIDRINYTADNNAITSQDLVDGLLVASSVAKTANMSFDQTVGVLTALKEASGRTGKEVGNAFKSILTYIQRPKSLEGFDAMGIEVFADKATGTLLPMMDILTNMSTKWSTMSTSMQDTLVKAADEAGLFSEELAIATGTLDEYQQATDAMTAASDKANDAESRMQANLAAGVYRRNYYIALMENMQKALQVTADLQNAEGYSMQENSKHLDTLKAKYTQLIAALENLAVHAGDSGLLGLAKGALELATGLAKVSTNAYSIPILVGAITAAVSLCNKEMKFLGAGAVSYFANLKTNAAAAGMSMTAFAAKTVAARVQLVALKAAVVAANVALTMGISAGIQILIDLFQRWGDAIKETRAETDAIIESTNQLAKSIESSQKAIQDSANSKQAEVDVTKELVKQLETLSEKENLNAGEKQYLLDIVNKLNEAYPDLNLRIDEETGKLEGSTAAIYDNIAAREKQILAQAAQEKAIQAAKDKLTAQDNIADAQKRIQELEELRSKMPDMTQSLITGVNDASATYGAELDRQIRELNDSIKQNEEIIENANEALQRYTEFMRDGAYAATDLSDATNSGASVLDAFISNASSAANTINALTENVSLLDSAMQKAAEGSALNVDEVFKLISAYPQLATAVQYSADGYYIEAEALERVRIAVQQARIEQELMIAVKEFAATATANQRDRLNELIQAMQNATTAEAVLTAQTALYQYMAQNATSASSDLAVALAKIGILINEINTGFSGAKYVGGTGGKTAAQKRIEALQKETKTIQDEYEKQIKAAREAAEAVRDSYNEQIKAIKERYDAEIKAARRAKEERDRNRERADIQEEIEYWSKRTGVEAFDKLKDAQKKLREKEEDWSWDDYIQGLEDARDAEVKRLEELRDAEIERYEAEIKRLEELKEAETKKRNKEIEALQQIAAATTGMYEAMQKDIEDTKKEEAQRFSTLKEYGGQVFGTWTELYSYARKVAEEARLALQRQAEYTQRMAQADSWSEKTRIFNERQGYFPSSHTGSYVAKEGLVNVAPGQVIVRPDITAGLLKMVQDYNSRIANITNNNVSNSSATVINNFNAPLNTIEKQEIHDTADKKLADNSVVRTITRELQKLTGLR